MRTSFRSILSFRSLLKISLRRFGLARWGWFWVDDLGLLSLVEGGFVRFFWFFLELFVEDSYVLDGLVRRVGSFI